jgi:uncharacterized membrane protein YfcA
VVIGTMAGRRLLDYLSERTFRRAVSVLLIALAALLLVQLQI